MGTNSLFGEFLVSPLSNRHRAVRFGKFVASMSVVAALSACGGGGGGSSSTALDGGSGSGASVGSNVQPGVIPTDARSTGANGNFSGSSSLSTLSPTLIKAVLGSSGPNSAPGSSIFAEPTTSRAQSLASPVDLNSTLSADAVAHWVADLASRRSSQATGVSGPQAVTTESQGCNFGGSIRLAIDDVNNNKELDAGDAIDATFLNCRISGSATFSGGFKMVFNAVEWSADDDLIGFDSTVTYNNFGVIGLPTINGLARIWRKEQVDGQRTFVRYFNSATIINGNSVQLNYDIDTFHSQNRAAGSAAPGVGINIRGTITVNGASYGLVTPTTLGYEFVDSFPISGVLRAQDAVGNTIVITAKGNSVGRSYVAASQTTPALTLPDAVWANIN